MTHAEISDDRYEAKKFTLMPLRFCTDGYYRVAADITCKKCWKRFVQILRCHRRRLIGSRVITAAPDPGEETMAIAFIMKAHQNHDTVCLVAPMNRPADMLVSTETRPQ